VATFDFLWKDVMAVYDDWFEDKIACLMDPFDEVMSSQERVFKLYEDYRYLA